MKIRLDESLPATLAHDLTRLGHDCDTVLEEGLKGQPDSVVLSSAQHDHRFLITQDLDFSDIRKFKPGPHADILLVRLSLSGRQALANRIRQMFTTEDVESWTRCFVVAIERKVRIRRPR